MTWRSISLYKYQQIEEINKRDLSDMDKVLFSACQVFDKTESELDNTDPQKVLKMTTRMQRIFETPLNTKSLTKIGRYVINYDVSKMTFGQYIELAFFLSDKEKVIARAHFIMATISYQWMRKHMTADHRKKANYFSHQPIEKVLGAINLITENFNQFNSEYKNFFGVDKDVSGDVTNDDFNKRYGWIYSATRIKEHEGITLDEAFAMPVRQAFNDLMFMKAKDKYEALQFKKMKTTA
jgi:hypothetical protein